MSAENTETTEGNGRNLLLVLGGFALLGIALTLLIFGGTLFGNGRGQEPAANIEEDSPVVLQQVPEFEDAQSGAASQPDNSNLLEVGDTPPDFTLRDLDGNPVSLSDFQGQPVIVNFWATWCAPCRIEMPELQAAFEKYRDDGLVILALDQDEPEDTVRSFFYDEMGLTFTPLLDVGGDVAERYRVFNFPSTFFIDPDGVITAIHRGPMAQSQIEGYLADTLPAAG